MYTIVNKGSCLQGLRKRLGLLKFSLREKLRTAGFTCNITHAVFDKGSHVELYITNVRLPEKRPYCGQHPGSCPIGAPKPRYKYLEWDDWIRFNNVVNAVLDVRSHHHFEVFSRPLGVRGRFWIRKNNKARKHYDWEEKGGSSHHPIRVWNKGTEDQFED